MLDNATHALLREMKLDGVAEAFEEIQNQDAAANLSHVEWLGLLIDRGPQTAPQSGSEPACAPPNSTTSGPLSKASITRRRGRSPKPSFSNLPLAAGLLRRGTCSSLGPFAIVTRTNGVPMAHRLKNLARLRSRPESVPRQHNRHLQTTASSSQNWHWRTTLLGECSIRPPAADGRFPRIFRQRVKADLLILDDCGLERLTANQRRDMTEIVEVRYGSSSTIITSQLPVEAWHDVIDEPTFADAILVRIAHNAHHLNLDGPSLRKTHDALKSVDGGADD